MLGHMLLKLFHNFHSTLDRNRRNKMLHSASAWTQTPHVASQLLASERNSFCFTCMEMWWKRFISGHKSFATQHLKSDGFVSMGNFCFEFECSTNEWLFINVRISHSVHINQQCKNVIPFRSDCCSDCSSSVSPLRAEISFNPAWNETTQTSKPLIATRNCKFYRQH